MFFSFILDILKQKLLLLGINKQFAKSLNTTYLISFYIL